MHHDTHYTCPCRIRLHHPPRQHGPRLTISNTWNLQPFLKMTPPIANVSCCSLSYLMSCNLQLKHKLDEDLDTTKQHALVSNTVLILHIYCHLQFSACTWCHLLHSYLPPWLSLQCTGSCMNRCCHGTPSLTVVPYIFILQ